jgi:hypothetical protein
MSISNPADCKMSLAIRFFNSKNIHTAEIQCQLVEVYMEVVMKEGVVRKWYRLLNEKGRLCTVKCDLDARLSSQGNLRTVLKLTFLDTGYSLLMSFMEFSHVSRLSHFNSDTLWRMGSKNSHK